LLLGAAGMSRLATKSTARTLDEYAAASVGAAEDKPLDDQMAAGELAVTARESALSILVVYNDDDRSACDYLSAGPYLQRK
jgi:hypothetical protein